MKIFVIIIVVVILISSAFGFYSLRSARTMNTIVPMISSGAAVGNTQIVENQGQMVVESFGPEFPPENQGQMVVESFGPEFPPENQGQMVVESFGPEFPAL